MMTTTQQVTVTHGDLGQDAYWAAQDAGSIAWDIETSGLDWAQDGIGTCQIATATQIHIVVLDQQHLPKRLSELLEAPEVRKVFHHAPFDLRFLAHQWDTVPRNIACTKIASKIVDSDLPHDQHSLQPVLRRHLDVTISKMEQRSDWLAPELTQDQLRYAAADVAHLLPLCARLEERATAHGVHELLTESWRYLATRTALDLRGPGDVFAY
jgi:ribonuclease D